MSRTYTNLLETSHERTGTLLCLGIDPVPEYLPKSFGGTPREQIVAYVSEIVDIVVTNELIPAAFKANIGFYHCLDRPRAGEFDGSRALAEILDLIADRVPGVPVILDVKRGDIARSSANYGHEAFRSWGVDAMTAPAYMGRDSVEPLLEAAEQTCGLVYVLVRTSNPGSEDLQVLQVSSGRSVAESVAGMVSAWHSSRGCCGAVVGAPSILESDSILRGFADSRVPILVPGVGTQGGSAHQVMAALRRSGYPLSLARINVSSEITHPWRDRGAPDSWRESVTESIRGFHEVLR